MAGRFVRSSKYRHVFGRPTRKEQCYDNIRISKNAWDTNLIKANPRYLSVNWEASGGGAFAVIPLNEKGRLPEQLPLFRGHTAVVLDTDWSPFDDSLIASGSDDGKAFIWRVPEGLSLYTDADEPTDVAPMSKLVGHSRKVGHVLFNPAAANVLATSSGDFTIKMWDISTGGTRLTLKHTDIVQSLSWSANGGLMVTTSRDKKLRIWDVRQEKPVHVGPGHAGAKNSRAVWMGEHDRIATTGFSKMSDRQLGLWDIRSAQEPIGGFDMLDSMSGVCMPFWDDSTQCLYLAGKGDGNIRYYEYENDAFEYLSEYKSADPQRGVAFLPKRGLNIHENEVMRAFKTVNDNYIEPISFIVPRRAEVFQGDIYPPVPGTRPAMTAQGWFEGGDGIPPKIDLESVYAGEEPTEIPSDYKPRPPPTPSIVSPTKNVPEPVKEVPQPSPALRGPPPSMKEQTSSIKDLASKFIDKDAEESEDEDDSSSFEEVPKPVDRSEKQTRGAPVPVEKTEPVAIQRDLDGSSDRPAKHTATPSSTARSDSQMWKKPEPLSQPSAAAAPSASLNLPPTPAVGTEPIQGYLQEIKSLLQQQNLTMAAQSAKIGELTSEVDHLKTNLSGASNNKDEKIRQLEKELAALRSS
ncbi:Coronin-like protein crn1 [Trapelia coarctata]|nr:Coronin-like protein crn1 [Trapelia coarctata]